jgi:predicted transcriptional regulator
MTGDPRDHDTVEMTAEERQAFLNAVEEGLADADAGRTISFEKIRRWLLSWGTDHELPPPE